MLYSQVMQPRRLGHFEIVEALGAGGMGEVYKARDLNLERVVALKLMRESAARGDSKRRFGFEARAASALNHPNIVTIYEISSFEDGEFIAMEFVEGETLARILARGTPPLDTVLNYALQAADALAAAHAAEIVHRDFKPANVMVTPRGLVKVLDFGLAKSTRAAGVEGETVTAHTEQGAIVGTLSYMSPEQAEGRLIDARSDVFSFGAVLYELVTGQRAFRGDSKVSTLAAILRDDPRPVSRIRAGVPPGLDDVIRRCLCKSPDERFQRMEDVRTALERLREAGPAARSRTPWFAAIAASLLMVASAAYLYHARNRSPAPQRDYALTRITSDSGLTTEPALSRDGKLLAYASDRSGGSLDLWVRQVSGGDSVRLTQDPADEHEPSFSPDGSRIAFRSERDGGGVYVIPSLGGEIRLIAKEGRRPRFSPDGRSIAYWVMDLFTRFGKIYVIPATGGTPRRVGTEFDSIRDPVWSPDGKFVLVNAADKQQRDWWVVPADDVRSSAVKTGARDLFAHAGLDMNGFPGDWWNDRVMFAAVRGDTQNIWGAELSPRSLKLERPPERVTVGSSVDTYPSIANSGAVAFSSGTETVDLWSLPIDASGREAGPMTRLPGNGASEPDDPSISTDGHLAFASERGSTTEIRLRAGATGQESVVISTSTNDRPLEGIPDKVSHPVISPDGARIAFRHMSGNASRIAVIPASGGAAQDLCPDCGTPLGWEPSGRSVLFANRERRQKIGLLDMQTRASRIILQSDSWSFHRAQVSPDSRFVAINARVNSDRSFLFVTAWNDGNPQVDQWRQVTDATKYVAESVWSQDGSAIYFVDGIRGQILTLRLDARTKRPLGQPRLMEPFPFARYKLTVSTIAAASRQLIFPVREALANVWMNVP